MLFEGSQASPGSEWHDDEDRHAELQNGTMSLGEKPVPMPVCSL